LHAEPVLATVALTKRFGGTLALDGVDLELRAGEVTALLGENGAGKSTLIKILAGVHAPDAGEVRLRGRAVSPGSERLPISFVHQDLGLVDSMSVAENVALVAGYPRRFGLIDWAEAQRLAAAALEAAGGGIDPAARVGEMPAAERSVVAIARALATEADLLVLDEPTAALPEGDVARLLDRLRRLRERGLAILYVTHRLDEVFRVADRVVVLRDGRRVLAVPVAETAPEALVRSIIGRAPEEVFRAPPAPRGAPLLTVEGLVTDGAGPASLTLHAGEVLALVGLRGAGHHAIGRALFGAAPVHAGTMELAGRPFRPASPADAVAAGLGFVSSRRVEESLAPSLTVRENLVPNRAARPDAPGLLGTAREAAMARRTVEAYGVRPPEPERAVATLSGGNQQKAVLARWLEGPSRALVLEEPTFGVDVGAKAEIYRLLGAAARAGRSALLISSDFEEVAGVAHRALVVSRGRVAAELGRAELSVATLTALAAGAAPAEAAA
jgi:ribose transport system ATP-binding protein